MLTKEKVKRCDYKECENPYDEWSPIYEEDEKHYHLQCWIKLEIDKRVYDALENHEIQFH
jgi:hypothetical protein